MTQTEWADRPNPAEMRQQYRAIVDLARRGGFQTPESGWQAELVVAHLVATTEKFLEVGAGVRRGERPDCGDPDATADEALVRRAAESGGLAGLSARLEESGERLAALGESLSDAEAATPVRFTVYHEGRQLVDEPRAFGKILAGHASFHLPLHLRQLEALPNGS
jgi:DinB superfamily